MKKIFKIILAIIGMLIMVFLLAGLIVPKVSYQTEILVNKPIHEVWVKYNDLSTVSEWIPEVKKITPLKETNNKVGSEYEMVVENEGQTITMIETITAFKPLEEVGLRFDAGHMIKTDMTRFSREGETTRITSDHVCQGANYIHRCMFAFFKSMFKNIDQTYMDQFKTWVEEGDK